MSENFTLPDNFAPWGGFVLCEKPDGFSTECADLAESLTGQTPGGLSTCVAFSEGSVDGLNTEYNETLKGHCVCNIAYGRRGADCLDANEPGWGYLIIPNLVLNVYVIVFLGHTLWKAKKLGVLVPSAATTTTITTFVCSILVSLWTLIRLLLFIGGPEGLYQMNLMAAGICAGGIVVDMLVVTLVFQAVQASTKKMKKGTGGDGISQKQKKLVLAASVFVFLSIVVLIFAGQNRLASIVAMLYIVICFVLYIRAANNMKALLKSASTANSSGGPNIKAQQAFGRILKLINQIIFFVCVFVPSAAMYSATSTDTKSSRLTVNPPAAIGLFMMHFSGSFAVLWIADFAAGPLLTKTKSSSSTGGTSVASSVTPSS